MWKIRSEIRNKRKNTLKIEKWIADNNTSETFGVFCFNTSAAPNFALTLEDPSIKLNIWLVWCEIWHSVCICSKNQSTPLFIFTQIKWMLLVSYIRVWSNSLLIKAKQYFASVATNFNKKLTQLNYTLEHCWGGKSSISGKPLFGHWLSLTAGKYCLTVSFQCINSFMFWSDSWGSVNSIQFIVTLI